MALRFEWDPRKAAANLKKHGVSFQEATSAFRDPLSVTISDPDHAGSEERESLAPGAQRERSKVNMKTNGPKRKTRSGAGTMRREYDFSKGIRGKHADSYAAGTNVVVLEPDVAAEFRTSEEVNETLRALAGILHRRKKRATRKVVNTTPRRSS